MGTRLGLGLRAQKGGAVAVVVRLTNGAPEVLLSSALATHAEGERLSLEPYRVAHEMVGSLGASIDEAAAAVADGRERQDHLAETALRALHAQFGGAPLVAGLLVNRAGWVTDLLRYSLEWADHVPVAEGLAVRDALRFGLRGAGIASIELDEKSLLKKASEQFCLTIEAIEAQIKALGGSIKPWRKEQKLAALAAWIVSAPC